MRAVRPLLLTASCLLALAAAPRALQAQQGTLTITPLSIGDREYSSVSTNYINAAECADGDTELVVRVGGLGGVTQPNVAVWVGNNCNLDRSMSGGTTSSDCVLVYQEPRLNQPMIDMVIRLGALPSCSGTSLVKAYFMPMNMPSSTTEMITAYGTAEFQVDTQPPPVPTSVTGGSGETQIEVNWSSPGGDIARYYVYWDADLGGGGDEDAGMGDCATSALHQGADIDPASPPAGVGKEETASNVTSIQLDGTKIGADMAGVAVQAEDLAGNRSTLSETACIDVVETSGFWDMYRANGGTAESGCACSLPGATPRGASGRPGLALGLAFGLVALLSVRRRRHS